MNFYKLVYVLWLNTGIPPQADEIFRGSFFEDFFIGHMEAVTLVKPDAAHVFLQCP